MSKAGPGTAHLGRDVAAAMAFADLDAMVQAEKRERAERAADNERRQIIVLEEQRIQNRYALFRAGRPCDGEERVSIPVHIGLCSRLFAGSHSVGMLAARGTRLGVIVCHPWGPLGGSFNDFHVQTVVHAFRHVTTLRINFRTGLDFGYGAESDVRAACDYLLGSIEAPPDRLLLVGYSYGALVVAGAAPHIDACAAFAMLAPPLGVTTPLFGPCRQPEVTAAKSRKSKLALMGTFDQFCRKERFEEWAEGLEAPAEYHLVTGRDVVHVSCCGDTSCNNHPRKQLVHHFNVR